MEDPDNSPENCEFRRSMAIEYFRSIDPERLPSVLTYPMMYPWCSTDTDVETTMKW